MAPERKVTLKSWDQLEDESFEVDEAIAQESELLKDMIEAVGVEAVIPLPNVSRKTLAKVIEFCKYHVHAVKNFKGNPAAADYGLRLGIRDHEIMAWDRKFINVDQETLFHLLNAANYLNIKKLLKLTCKSLARSMQDMSLEEVRTTFNLNSDLTPEEVEAVIQERG